MYRAFGLSRDPFADVSDGALFWENDARAGARERAAGALLGGRGVWLRGASGCGRETLVTRLAEQAARVGRRVLLAPLAPRTDGPGLLAALLETAGVSPPDPSMAGRAETLYAELLDAFRAGGPPVVALCGVLEEPGALREFRILSQLRLLGRPLALVVGAGPGASPAPGLEQVSLPDLVAADAAAFLRARAAACGQADLLGAAELDEICRDSEGFAGVLARARAALRRRAFRRGSPSAAALDGPAPALDEAEFAAAERLLDELSPPAP